MRNSKETLEQIRYHKGKSAELRKKIKALGGELVMHNRLARELDEVRTERLKKKHFRASMARRIQNQDLVVGALRMIGEPTTAGQICHEMEKSGIECHVAMFACRYLDDIRLDRRVIVTPVNARKNEYSLREWKGN